QDGIRPTSIQVQLYADGKAKGDPVTLTEANTWTHTWQELDEKASGKEIVYTVKEVGNIPGYTVSMNGQNAGNIIITNSHTPEVTEITGKKTWNDKDNQDGKRPESITVNLLANGEKVDEQVVTEKTNWNYTFTNLPKYQNGEQLIYTVTENDVLDYSTEITGYDITNNYTPGKTSVTVTKAWNDSENQDGIRPTSIQVQLYADGKAKGDSVTLTEANTWTHTWQELDEKASGKEIVYTVKEVGNVPGYTVSMNGQNAGNIIITNSHTPEVTEITGKKTWNDKDNQDGKRPESITVNLLANGEKVDEQVVTEKTNWNYTFTNLPKYQNGEQLIYTVTENDVLDYSTEITGYDITNNYTPGKTSVTVTKAWNDSENQDGIRPTSIQVQLYADGKAKGDPVTLT
ncbi:Cna B-type domain-containing protein, partial [Vagococcus fluvialis]